MTKIVDNTRDLDPTATEILGTVAHVQGKNREPEFCRIQPTHHRVENSWLAIGNPKRVFPDVGLVFWWNPHTYVRKGNLRRFYVEEEKVFKKGQRHDWFQVRGGASSVQVEVVSVPDPYDLAALRQRIAAVGLFAALPLIGRGLVALTNSQTRYVGLFEQNEDQNDAGDDTRLRCDISTGFLRTYEMDQSAFQKIRLDGHERVVLKPDATLSPPSGYFNVQADADLIKALANVLRRDASNSAEARMFQKRIVEQSISLLASAGHGSRDRQRDEARLEAARALASDTKALETEVAEIEKILESLPSVQKLKEGLKAELEARLAAEMFDERTKAQTALAEDQIKAQASLEAVKAQTEEVLEQAKRSVEALMDNAAGALTEYAVVRRLFETSPKSRPKASAVEAHVVPPLGSLDEIWAKIVATARARGDDSFIAGSAAGLMAGSQIVLLTGLRAVSLAITLSHAIGGGGACIAPVAPTMFALGDLLNAPVSPIDRIPCYADVLGDFLVGAMEKSHVSVVVLQGINRAPPENILLELADEALGSLQDKWLRWRASSGEIRDVSIDGRILFLGTVTDGAATFRFSNDLAIKLPVVLADRQEVMGADSLSSVAANSVPFEVWQKTSDFELQDQNPSIKKLVLLKQYRALARILPRYVTNVCGLLTSAEVGVAEAVWALTFGRLEDSELKGVLGELAENQARKFVAMVDAGETVRVRRFFGQGDVQ